MANATIPKTLDAGIVIDRNRTGTVFPIDS